MGAPAGPTRAEPVVDPRPFSLVPESGATGAAALCLHGLTGTPYEVRPLGEALVARGIAAFGPALPGHGETPEALAALAGPEVWLDAAREHARALRSRHDKVYGVGLSMGGLLSLVLAAEGRLDAIAVVGVPLALSLPVRLVVPWLWRLRSYQGKAGGSDIRDPAARARHPSYPLMPLRSVASLIRLQRQVWEILPRVRVPILVAHGALDRTARPADADALVARVGSDEKRQIVCLRSGHVVPVDVDGPVLARDVADFLASQGRPGAG